MKPMGISARQLWATSMYRRVALARTGEQPPSGYGRYGATPRLVFRDGAAFLAQPANRYDIRIAARTPCKIDHRRVSVFSSGGGVMRAVFCCQVQKNRGLSFRSVCPSKEAVMKLRARVQTVLVIAILSVLSPYASAEWVRVSENNRSIAC